MSLTKWTPSFFIAEMRVFEWSEKASLVVSPTLYKLDGKIVFGLRKVVLQNDLRGNQFALLYNFLKPAEELGAKATEDWGCQFGVRILIDNRSNPGDRDSGAKKENV